MSNPVTLEDIFQLFQRSQEEGERRFAEADRRAAEAERRAEEAKAEAKAEAERRAEEAKAEAERRAEEAKAEADRRAAEWEREFAAYRAENDRLIKRLEKNMDGLTSRWGRFVENIVAPAVLRLFQEKGFQVQEVHQRMRSGRGSRNLEIDIFVVDDDVAIVVEVKSRLTQNEVRQVLNTLSHFKTAFPHYQTYRIYGAVAAIEIDKDVDTYAYNQGLFVIKQSGDSVKISKDRKSTRLNSSHRT